MKRKIMLFLLIICMMFCGVIGVKAADSDSYSIDVEVSYGDSVSLTLTLNGELDENSGYFVKFVNEDDKKPEIWSDHNAVCTDDIDCWKAVDDDSVILINDDWYMLDGYDYAYIMISTDGSSTVLDTPIRVERPQLPDLGKRYKIIFQAKKSFLIKPRFPYGGQFSINGSHKRSVKIGVINDEKILYSIYKEEKGSLEKLMNYAKNDTGVATSQFLDSDISVPFDKELKDGAYYYLYTTYENSDGMYRDLSDINIFMCKNGILSNDVEWNFNEDKTESSTATTTQKQETNPKTSDVNNNLVLIILAGSIALAVVAKKRIKKLSK